MRKFLQGLPKAVLVELLVALYEKLTLVKFNIDRFKKEFENASVSILVLLDFGIKRSRLSIRTEPRRRFNPCFIGLRN